MNYRLGFCSFGPTCEYRHVRRPIDELPAISELWMPDNAIEAKVKREIEKPGSTWRSLSCKNYHELGWCPFFDQCKYAHSDSERIMRGPTGIPIGGFDPKAKQRGATAMRKTDPNAPDVTSLNTQYETQNASLRSAGMPDLSTGPCKYLIMRSSDVSNLVMSLRRGEWIVTGKTGDRIAQALRGAAQQALPSETNPAGTTPSVYLFFSIINSKFFQGVARVRAQPRIWEGSISGTGGGGGVDAGVAIEGQLAPASGGLSVVPVEWLRTCELPFSRTKNLRNPLKDMKPIAMSSDCEELPVGLGRAMMVLSFTSAQVRVATDGPDQQAINTFHVLDAASETGGAQLSSEDYGADIVAAAAMPPGTYDTGDADEGPDDQRNFIAEAPPADAWTNPAVGEGLPRLLPAAPLILGTPASGPGPANHFIRGLLDGYLPPNTPPPSVICADTLLAPDKRVFLVALNNVLGPLTIGRGVLAASDDTETRGPDSRQARDLASIKAGTPIVCVNLHTRSIFGVFLARGPVVRELCPGLAPRMGARSFPMHIPVVCVAECRPLLEREFSPILRGMFPTHIGFLHPQPSHGLLAKLISTMPLPQQFVTAALLSQMNTTGAYPFLTSGPSEDAQQAAAAGEPHPIGSAGTPITVADAEAVLKAAGDVNVAPLPTLHPDLVAHLEAQAKGGPAGAGGVGGPPPGPPQFGGRGPPPPAHMHDGGGGGGYRQGGPPPQQQPGPGGYHQGPPQQQQYAQQQQGYGPGPGGFDDRRGQYGGGGGGRGGPDDQRGPPGQRFGSGPGGPGGGGPGGGACFKCGQPGHMARDCPNSPGPGQGGFNGGGGGGPGRNMKRGRDGR